MRGHLNDTEMTEALQGSPPVDVLSHIAGCPSCRAECERLQATLTGVAEQAREWANRSDATWDRQARQIMARARERQRPPRWRWVWAPALVGMAGLAGVWFHNQRTQVVPPLENDEALLAAVERSIQTDVPAALRPLALLVGEVKDGEAKGSLDMEQGG